MRQFGFAAACLFLGACTAPPPIEQGSLDFSGPGSTPATIHNSCANAAIRQCPRASIRCEAYVRGFTRSCMANNGVSAEYIIALTH